MRQRGRETFVRVLGAALTVGLFVACGFGPRGWTKQGGKKTEAVSIGLTAEETATFTQRFEKDIWPLLIRAESHCTGCHTAANASQLRLSKDADSNFKSLLADGHFDIENPASLLSRITALPGPTRMPPEPFKPWSDDEITRLRAFCNDLYAKRKTDGVKTDEFFPPALLTPFNGKRPATAPDNTFLTYYQLRGKVKAIFNDDWKRGDKDLFIENLAQFGGADFVRSFNESAKPTAQFLSGVDALAQDVVSRAYLAATGPFAGRADNLPSPVKLTTPPPAYRHQINLLYRRMLFRDATPAEIQASFAFLKSLYGAERALTAQGYELRFELTARNADGLATTQEVALHVANDPYGLGQTLVNETEEANAEKFVVRRTLDGPFTFQANDTAQAVVISNVNTYGNVLVHGIELRGPLPDATAKLIKVDEPGVQAQGAWKLSYDHGVVCYEDENQNKGASSVTIPVKVEKSGQYEVALLWRKGGRKESADNVLVEVQSHDKSRLTTPAAPPTLPKGEARFAIDMSDDTQMFADLKTAFQFAPGDGVEISNTETRGRVVADAVKFVPTNKNEKTFLVPAKDADGQDRWQEYQKEEYSFYTPVGPRLVTDNNDKKLKGKLHLLYHPASAKKEWKPEGYYRVEVGHPGSEQNDTHVPIIVHAHASSPIVRGVYPVHAHVGAAVTLDASSSYNLQGSPLQFVWRQVGGARVNLSNPSAAKLTFVAPTWTAEQAAWEGLCRALMKHPDFLFTRPLSLAATKDPATRRRLQLVKIAQDLVGRTPTETEVAKLEKGASLASLVDGYLASQEFADFYFRRIRLYLESHGTDEQDEPARLWSYIAFNDRPFKEILTADYTVDANWKKQSRPSYYGHSGVLTMKGFIEGKPGLPHFNYAAQVCEKFLGYVFEVPLEIVKIRNGIAAASTTSPSSVCYSCHKILTPLAHQRLRWTDLGVYKPKDENGQMLDDSDQQLVPSYPFRGNGMEAFALQAQNKERFVRMILQTHYLFYFGREMRYDRDERGLYKRLWDTEKANNYNIKGLIRALVTSPEYLNGTTSPLSPPDNKRKLDLKPRNFAYR